MDSLISRQDAIDAIKKESQVDGAYGYMDTKSIIDCLNDLPSAQPEETCESCLYRELDWHEEPCDSCTVGGNSSHYKPSIEKENR